MLIVLSRLLHLFIFGVLIFRYSKQRFKKHNFENACLITISGISLTVFEREYMWFYPLLVIEILLFLNYIVRSFLENK